ncbi:MAG: peptide chain release factor N(5)-glutamine methyltransferase [Rugosibacter sp.]|nr:peptide chain release factor N(5)-glutamine methyltransferase [Rugosibacter sp.]
MTRLATIAEAFAATRGMLPASEARLLLAHVMGKPAAWLLAHDEQTLPAETLTAFQALLQRRAAGEPVAYLLGRREFYGRDFSVSPAVLIPRPETELLVEFALRKVGAGEATGKTTAQQEGAGQNPARFAVDALQGGRAKNAQLCRPGLSASRGGLLAVADGDTATILDLGAGSGCIAITLALECPGAQVTAIDASPAALAVAQENARRLAPQATVRFLASDWFSALAGERFDLIVSNPPYIAAADPHLAQGDLRHEPRTALASGADGLDAIANIIALAPEHLTPGGGLWLEHGYDQAAAVRALLAAAGFTAIEQHRDLAGIVRISGGRRK